MRQISLLTSLLSLWLLASCDEVTVNPIVESNQYYTVLGYLNMGAQVHYVRVVPLRGTVTQPDTPDRSAKVRTTDLNTGEQVAWRDSLVTLSDGKPAIVYYARFYVQDNHLYKLEVIRPDGKITSAETLVPQRSPLTFSSISVSPRIGFTSIYTQTLTYTSLSEIPYDVEVWYRYYNGHNQPFTDVKMRYQDVYGRKGSLVDGKFQVTINYTEDKVQMERKEIYNPTGATLYGVGIRLIRLDDTWKAPNGVWDPEVIAQPNVFTNVNNGFGYFGAVGQFDREWILPDDVVTGLGYGLPTARP